LNYPFEDKRCSHWFKHDSNGIQAAFSNGPGIDICIQITFDLEPPLLKLAG